MNYYILQQDPRIPNQPGILRSPEEIEPTDWIDGRVLPEPPGPLRFQLQPRSGRYRGCIIGGLVTLFHKILIDELLRLGIDNFQHFPVELETPDGEIETPYSLINIIGLIEAVDEDNSILERWDDGSIDQLYSFKIDPDKAKGKNMFRILEEPTLIIIDQTLYEGLLAFNPPGVMMLPTESYEGWAIS